MNNVWYLFLALGVLCAFALTVSVLRARPGFVLAILGSVVAIAWEVPSFPVMANVGGMSIYLPDVISIGLLTIAVLNVRQLTVSLRSGLLAWSLLSIALLFALLRGLVWLDPGSAVAEFRVFLYVFAALAWVLSIDWANPRFAGHMRRFATVLGWALVGVAIYHVVRYGWGGASDFVSDESGIEQTGRPLISGQALVLFLCAVTLMTSGVRKGRLSSTFTPLVFLGAVILSQQRTVWVVALACFLICAVRISRRTMVKAVIGLFVVLFAFAILALGIGDGAFIRFSESATNTGTYQARLNSWSGLISQSMQESATVYFGAPFGSGFGRFEGAGRWVTFSPHNWYLTIYLRSGLIGLFLILGILAGLFWAAYRSKPSLFPLAVLAVMAVYGWSYSWVWYSVPFLGWAIFDLNRRSEVGAEDARQAYPSRSWESHG